MKQRKSCGILVLRETPPPLSFLLMRHPDRYDLPKGHIKAGESERACALRELLEETGITPDEIDIDPGFRHQQTYQAVYKRLGGEKVEKTLVMFLGRLVPGRTARDLVLSEHQGAQWMAWAPPHRIQEQSIDPLLAAVAHYLGDGDGDGLFKFTRVQ